MALEIVWTKRAEKGYEKIVEYLEKHWTDREIQTFVKKTNEFLELLKEYPSLLEESKKKKHLHRGPLNKHTILTYRVRPRKKVIEILNIRPSRMKPLD